MIKITVVSYNNEATSSALSALFDRQGGTLGRDEDNHFVLPDPKRLVSRKQASLKSDGARHTIVNLSQANPILVNGQEIGFGQEYALQKDDEIRIGLYVLCVEPQSVAATGHLRSVAHTAAHETPRTNALAPTPAKLIPVAGKSSAQVASDAASLPAPTADPVDSQALIDAFLSGAGIPHISLGGGLTPELMETIGKLMATAIEGTFDLVASRALVKREVNAEVTTVVVRNNNPLKFLPDGQTVLIQMLRKKMPGFMGPVETMQDAYKDLRTHQDGMAAGVRAAMDDMLEQCSPQLIEQQHERSTLDAIAPMRRKARLWDAYAELHEDILQKTRAEYQAPFGKAFLAAYEKAVERLENEALDD